MLVLVRRTLIVVFLFFACIALSAPAAQFKVGFAQSDITPTKPMPMWGYGARYNVLSEGVRDPLFAKAVVIDVGEEKAALVGLDLGRSPRPEQVDRIRAAVKEKAGVGFILLVGSHTHHGPVLELKDEPEKGKGVYDDAVAYTKALESKLIDVIVAVAANVFRIAITAVLHELVSTELADQVFHDFASIMPPTPPCIPVKTSDSPPNIPAR